MAFPLPADPAGAAPKPFDHPTALPAGDAPSRVGVFAPQPLTRRGTPMAAEELRSRPRKDKGQPTPGPDAAADDRDNQKRESLKDLVRAQVLGALGAPADLLRVQ